MSQQSEVVLDIAGMTCASCVARVEAGLESLPGVTASVNLVTNSARVEYPSTVAIPQLVAAVSSLGYLASARPLEPAARSTTPRSVVARRDLRLWLAVGATIPVVVLAMVPAWQFAGWQWLSLVLATPVVFWCAWPIHRAAFRALRHGSFTMDTLISLGTLVAWGWSVYALFFGMAGMWGMTHTMGFFAWQQDPTANIYFETATGVTTFILFGRWLEDRAKRSAVSALEVVGKLHATSARVIRNEEETTVGIENLLVDDVVVVRPGETIPADGVVLTGASAVDMSALTGESIPVDVQPGATVSAGTISLDGRLEIRARAVRADTRLAQLGALVERAQLRKMSIQRFADKISSVFVPGVIGIAIITVVAWLSMGAAWDSALTAAVAVIVIACPCALGLATPVALIVGTGRAASLGIIISGAEVLERSAALDTVVLDKTGTITTGEMSVVRIDVAPDVSVTALMVVAAAVESGSEHPIARAIVARATANGAETRASSHFHAVAGGGASADVADSTGSASMRVRVGRIDWLRADGTRMHESLEESVARAARDGMTSVGVAWDDQMMGVIHISDTVRPDSAQAIARLRSLGLEPVMLTGDALEPARALAEFVGIERVHARVSPEEKVDVVVDAQRAGRSIAMVGDGINDAAALAQSDIGLAMGSGTDLAIAASDITLVRGNLSAAADAIVLARKTLRIIRGNLFWAFAYNVVMIPVAALGFLTPMLAGAAMAFSSLFVVLNSLRLRSVTLTS